MSSRYKLQKPHVSSYRVIMKHLFSIYSSTA